MKHFGSFRASTFRSCLWTATIGTVLANLGIWTPPSSRKKTSRQERPFLNWPTKVPPSLASLCPGRAERRGWWSDPERCTTVGLQSYLRPRPRSRFGSGPSWKSARGEPIACAAPHGQPSDRPAPRRSDRCAMMRGTRYSPLARRSPFHRLQPAAASSCGTIRANGRRG